MKKHNTLFYRTGEHQADFQHLLKLLAGFPLALQVVLANTTLQTLKQILTALQAGDATIDFNKADNTQSKTESLLRCIEYSYRPLSEPAQQLLLCLAPFKSVLFLPLLEAYSEKLKNQTVLANLPFDDWQSVLQEAQHWGLITAHEVDGFINLQPTLSYFLSHRLQQDKATQLAIQTAFREVYDSFGVELAGLIYSKEPQQKQIGQLFTQLEYENLSTALQLALTAQVSILNPYIALSCYLDSQQAQAQGLTLGKQVLQALETYPVTLLQGALGAEFVGVLDNIAKRYLLLKRYAEAEQSYNKVLSLWQMNKSFAEDVIKTQSAGIYHQLGIVAQQQQQYQQAYDYYQQALAIKIEFNNRYGQAKTYGQLGLLAVTQENGQQALAYLLQALSLFVEFQDEHNSGIALKSLKRVYQAHPDPALAGQIATLLNISEAEALAVLQQDP